jgi:hypothetical protein
MSESTSVIRVNVDNRNPGQFFGCCGLLELAARLWAGVEGWFAGNQFQISPAVGMLADLLQAVSKADLHQVDPDDNYSSAIAIGQPFDLMLDWWQDERSGGRQLKVWAGTMQSVRIARAMRGTLHQVELQNEDLFDKGMIVYDPDAPDKKVEPYYFDSRRGANAQALDIGFVPDALHMTTLAHPAVEFLCLVGLQRARPTPTDTPRVFDYFTWSMPLPACLLPAATAGQLEHVGAIRYRFENAFRTDQRKHKAFLPATSIRGDK